MFEKREQPLRYYDRENMPYVADHQRIAELTKWLKKVNWQVICTYTFGWQASDAEADRAFHAYINDLERAVKADVIYIRCDGKRFSGCGKPACGRHYHSVMSSAAPLRPAVLEFFWNENYGKQKDSARVLQYNPKRDGLAYALKHIHQPNGDWTLAKLHLALPGIVASNHRERRNLQRHRMRLKAFGSVELLPGGPHHHPV